MMLSSKVRSGHQCICMHYNVSKTKTNSRTVDVSSVNTHKPSRDSIFSSPPKSTRLNPSLQQPLASLSLHRPLSSPTPQPNPQSSPLQHHPSHRLILHNSAVPFRGFFGSAICCYLRIDGKRSQACIEVEK
jgi:hypothetical protein